MPDAVPGIALLVHRFDGRVWLISKCGARVEARTLRWRDAHDFYRRVPGAAIHARTRADVPRLGEASLRPEPRLTG